MESPLVQLALFIIMRRRRQRRERRINRRYWVHPILKSREDRGHFSILFEELKEHDGKFFKYFRMSVSAFNELLSILYEELKHEDTKLRKSIPPAERLAITLRYLATGCSFYDFQFTYRCGSSTARMIVKETCQILFSKLKERCIPEPTEDTWTEVAKKFQDRANFPNCLGAVDGKHVRIVKPQHSGSLYYNYKHFFSIVLLAVCDANYLFTFIDVGSYGKASDVSVYKESKLFKRMENQTLNISAPKTISNTSGPTNYCFVGDEAFGLSDHMLRPYSGQHLQYDKRIFNYRLSRARRYIKCTFGMLANKWRILHRPLNVSVDFAEEIVKACCILHNFVHKRDCCELHHESLTLPGLGDSGNFSEMPIRQSLSTREKFKDFFISEEGAVPWENSRI